MGNLTITLNEDSETLTSVFSHQRPISKETISNITGSDGYFRLSVTADLSDVYWEYSCKIKIVPASKSEDDPVSAEVILTTDNKEELKVWELPYNVPLEYAA